MEQLPEDREILARELLSESIEAGKEVALKFKGLSMKPIIELGDEVFFRKSKNFSFGDLVVYRKNGSFTVHRFIRKNRINDKVFFILKGDNLRRSDRPVEAGQIIGIVTKLKRKNKILILNSLKGKVTSLLYFMVSAFRLILIPQALTEAREALVKERAILRLIAKNKLEEKEKVELIELLKSNLSWEYLSERIKCNFLTPFFIKKIKDLNLIADIPQVSLEKLNNIRRLQIVKDTKSRRSLEIVLNAFNNKGIDLLIIKGPHLGFEVYEDTSDRWMGDIDLLVKNEDWFKAGEVLASLGFISGTVLRNYNVWGIKYLDNHIDFYKDDSKLELKSNIWAIEFPYFNYSFWEKARITQIDNNCAYFPSYEDTLLIACVNLVRHNFSGLIWFLDIKKIIDKFAESFEWQAVMTKIKEQDLSTVVYYALNFTDKLLCLQLPEDLLSKLKPNYLTDKLFNLVWDKEAILLAREGSAFKAKIPFELSLVLFAGKFNFKPKKFLTYITYLLKVIFPPLDFIRDKYSINAPFIFLVRYYIIRFYHFLLMPLNPIFKLCFRKVKCY